MIAFVADATPLHYLVQLRTGGQLMRVMGAAGPMLWCWWWNGEGEVAAALVPRACLRLVSWCSSSKGRN